MTRTRAEAGLEEKSRDKSPPTAKLEPDHHPEKKGQGLSVDIISAGRALEAGNTEKATDISNGAKKTPHALLLLARISSANGKHEDAIRYYHSLTDAHPLFETRRVIELAEALKAAGRGDEAATQLKTLLLTGNNLSSANRLLLMEKQASWLQEAGKNEAAIETYEKALLETENGSTRDRLNLNLGRALFLKGDPKRAQSILRALALKSARQGIMKKAFKTLKKNNLDPNWTAKERLLRVRTLITFRSWKEALATLQPLEKKSDSALAEEASWLKAQILFNRRRHYKEAIEALEPIVKKGGTYADEARFLISRSLSRLDRDEEAIKAYRSFALKTKRAGRKTEARFLAARLEFFLGRHKAALKSFEKLVGNGAKKSKPSTLDAGRQRDGHFLAGLLALQLGKSENAKIHLIAASRGTKNVEVLARNRYWTAVAILNTKKKDGQNALRAICEEDPTTWYSQLSARRLADLKTDLGACQLPPLSMQLDQASVTPLEQLSPLAAFLSKAGFFREASLELRRVEKSNEIDASTRDWVANYTALDAPHFAVRRASIGLKWPPAPKDWWRAQTAYPSPYTDLVKKVEQQHKLPSRLIYAVARKESMFDPHAVSRVGAMGMMQMMPRTYEHNRKQAGLPKLRENELPGPEQSIKAAGYEFASLFRRFGQSLPLAIMAYNAGPKAVSRWLDRSGDLPIDLFVEKAGFAQTRNYVKRVYKNLVRYRLLSGEPLPDLPRTAKRPKQKVSP